MNQRLSARVPKRLLSGNTLLILIIILCSSLSFLLGYFVGRTQSPLESSTTSFHKVITGSDDTASQSQNLLLPPEDNRSDEEAADRAEVAAVDVLQEIQAIEDSVSAAGDLEHESEDGMETPDIEVIKEALPGMKGPVTRSLNAQFTSGKKVSYFYTIQAGAFRNKREAERLKEILSRKGYTARLAAHGSKEVLYKVWIGSFKSKENAEAHALKFTRNERLKSFVVRRRD